MSIITLIATSVIHLFTTGDVHGSYFDSLYVGNNTRNSLLSIASLIDRKREEYGRDNVIFIDSGDILQGDGTAYYYNFVDTTAAHIYPLIAREMGYDAIVVGNHDIETGPAVYNRINRQLGIPFLAANAIDSASGKCHFQEYAILRRGGLKIAVIGLTNPNMRNWLDEDKLEGMDFVNPAEGFAQKLVDKVRKKEKPDIVILATHIGTGLGDGSQIESQGRDLLNTLHGVDIIVCSHDHRPCCVSRNGTYLLNGGSHCRNVGHASIEVDKKNGKVVSKVISTEVLPVDKKVINETLREKFRQQYETVKTFCTREIGKLEIPLSSKEAYCGMNNYLNLIHTVCLKESGADISFAAPLKFNGYVCSGRVLYNDLSTIYPFENALYVITMTGAEIRRYLEESYDNWIVSPSTGHVLKIENAPDARTGSKRWSFVARSYNFDSAAGINYTVDVTAPKGKRVSICSIAGTNVPFDENTTYKVCLTSYRASGGGGLLKAAGVTNADNRIIARHQEIRNLIYNCFLESGTITAEMISNPQVIGKWNFTPSEIAEPFFKQDIDLLFGVTRR